MFCGTDNIMQNIPRIQTVIISINKTNRISEAKYNISCSKISM